MQAIDSLRLLLELAHIASIVSQDVEDEFGADNPSRDLEFATDHSYSSPMAHDCSNRSGLLQTMP